ncbi:murein biosynthesis integral membrane protein MurJ [Caldicellulosiruptoraceae bacterium PP1]
MQFRKATKTALQLFLVTALTKLIGFVREMALGARFGTGVKTDSLQLALMFPNVLFVTILAAFSTSFIPFYTEIKENKGEEEGLKFTNNVINTLMFFAIIVSILGTIFSKELLYFFTKNIIAKDYSNDLIIFASTILKITFFMIIFTSSSNILQGFMQANGNFNKPVLSSIPFNLGIFLTIFLSYFSIFKRIDIYLVGFGFVFGYFLSFVYQYYNAKKLGFRFYPTFSFRDENLKKVVIFAAPVFISSAMSQLYVFVDRYLLGSLGEGRISAVNFASKFNDMIVGAFSSTIAIIAFSTLSNYLAKKDMDNFKRFFVSSVNVIILLMIPFSIGGMILNHELVRIVYERGHFTRHSTLMTAGPFFFYSFGFLGLGLRDILNRTLYSLHDSKTAVRNGVIAIILNITFDIIFINRFGHIGAAMGFSFANYIATFLLMFSLRKKLGPIGWRRIVNVFIKSVLAGIIMGIVIYIFKFNFINLDMRFSKITLITLICILLGASVYSFIIYLFRVEEARWLIKITREKFGI